MLYQIFKFHFKLIEGKIQTITVTRLNKRVWGSNICYFHLRFWTSYIISADKEDGKSVAILIFQIFQQIDQGFIKSAGPHVHSNLSRALIVFS